MLRVSNFSDHNLLWHYTPKEGHVAVEQQISYFRPSPGGLSTAWDDTSAPECQVHLSFLMFLLLFFGIFLQLPTYGVRWLVLYPEISVPSSSKPPKQPLMRPEMAENCVFICFQAQPRVVFDLNGAGLFAVRCLGHQDSSQNWKEQWNVPCLGSGGSGKVSACLGKEEMVELLVVQLFIAGSPPLA